MFGMGLHFAVAHAGFGHVEGGKSSFNFLTGNLLSNPGNPTISPWATNTMTVASAGANDPNSVAAYNLTNTGTGSDITQGGISFTANRSYKIRCVAKFNNNAIIFLAASDESTSNFGAYFNISTGVLSATSTAGVGVVESTQINALGNGWYECIVFGHFTSVKTADFDLRVVTASGSVATTSGRIALMAEPGIYAN